jgi:hypothetical protein
MGNPTAPPNSALASASDISAWFAPHVLQDSQCGQNLAWRTNRLRIDLEKALENLNRPQTGVD